MYPDRGVIWQTPALTWVIIIASNKEIIVEGADGQTLREGDSMHFSPVHTALVPAGSKLKACSAVKTTDVTQPTLCICSLSRPRACTGCLRRCSLFYAIATACPGRAIKGTEEESTLHDDSPFANNSGSEVCSSVFVDTIYDYIWLLFLTHTHTN
jgi:hypothetical protein